MTEEAVLGPAPVRPRAVWPLPRERVAGAGDGWARSSWAAAGLRNKRARGGQVTHGEDWREAEAWPELGVEGTGQCEGQSSSVTALMATTPAAALPRPSAERAENPVEGRRAQGVHSGSREGASPW